MGRQSEDVAEGEPHEAALRALKQQLAHEREQTQALLAGQRRVLEMLATGASLEAVLAALIRTIELQCEGLYGSLHVRRQQGDRIFLGVAPSLPESYIAALQRVTSSPPYLGPCAMAADLGEPVVTTDIATDLRWSKAWRELATSHGLRTCYSAPIIASNGEVLGSFGMYYRELRDPVAPHPQLLATATHLAGIAVEHKRAEQALKEVDRRKNEFLAMLAHELRNPLAPIRNALQILRLGETDAGVVRWSSEMIERQVDQLVRLVDDLLDVSRISRGRIELRRERVELTSVVSQAVETARSLAQSMDHELEATLPTQPIHLDADPARLAQVLGNLLNNACKFTDRGGRIWVSVEREGQRANVRVRDTGIGIPDDQLPHVFEMFTQVDKSLERRQSGLGIGLTLVRTLVELHGGTVEAHSGGELGQGSEFVVRLPVLVEAPEPPAPEPEEKSEPVRASAGARRILVVDDNRDAAESLASLLGLMGNVMRIASDGLEALQVAAAFRPHVILLDIGLPKLSGYEVSRQIQSQPWGTSIVLVALTGFGTDEDRQLSKAAGFYRHLVKPVEYQTLAKLLAELGPPT